MNARSATTSRRRRARASLAGVAAVALIVTGCTADPPAARLTLATGPAGAVYREIGQAFADVVNREWTEGHIDVLFTAAAVENARLLTAGEVDVAFVNIDVADAIGDDIVALARVFDSVLHVVVPADSPVERLADLDGRRVAGGLALSGTRFMTDEVLGVLGIDVDHVELSQADGAEAIRTGEVDALISLTGMPTPAIRDLAASHEIRLLDLAEDVDAVVERFPLVYFPVTVPSTMYEGTPPAVTLAVPSLLAVDRAMDERIAYGLVASLFDHAAELSAVRPEAGQINPRTGASTTPVPLHPGAAAWFRDHKP